LFSSYVSLKITPKSADLAADCSNEGGKKFRHSGWKKTDHESVRINSSSGIMKCKSFNTPLFNLLMLRSRWTFTDLSTATSFNEAASVAAK
jgi:hypothetical protein